MPACDDEAAMTTRYRTKLFKSIIDCGCTMGLDEFAEEAEFEDVGQWLEERGYVLTRLDGVKVGELAKQGAGRTP